MFISNKVEVHRVDLNDIELNNEKYRNDDSEICIENNQNDDEKANSENSQEGDKKAIGNANELDNQEEKRKDIKTIGISIAVTAVVIGFCITIFSFYDIGKISTGFVEEVSIVEIDEIQYVLAVQYEDKWLVKKCIYEGDELIINAENYMLAELIEKDIQIVRLKKETIDECMVSDSVFRRYEK